VVSDTLAIVIFLAKGGGVFSAMAWLQPRCGEPYRGSATVKVLQDHPSAEENDRGQSQENPSSGSNASSTFLYAERRYQASNPAERADNCICPASLPVSFISCASEHIDNLGAYTASRPETGLLIPSDLNS